jgi:pimeloyl-ACP methyl ester carboxylesterase
VTEALPTSDPDPQFLERPSGRLAFVDEGPRDAPALFAVHGVPGSVRDFRYLAPQLTPRVRFVRVDLPGFGASPPDARAIASFEGRVEVLVGLADHLGLARFAVLGHSMGGGTALLTASRHRQRVSALVLLASIGLRPHRGLGMSPRRFGLLSHGFAIPGVSRFLTRAARERYRRRRFPGADTISPRTFAIQFRAISAADFPAIHAAATGPLPPTLLAWAKDDAMVESAIEEELAAVMPGVRTLVYEEGGHNIQKTQAPSLAQAIAERMGA